MSKHYFVFKHLNGCCVLIGRVSVINCIFVAVKI